MIQLAAARPLTVEAQAMVAAGLRPGDAAIDATAGNGQDALFLARSVGPTGTVFAFDVQQTAIDATRRQIQTADLQNVRLVQRSHQDIAEVIPGSLHGRIAAVMFNLGYLPGSDHAVITRPKSTCEAITAAVAVLRSGGILTVVAYRGHPGGVEEAESVARLLSELDNQGHEVELVESSASLNPAAPQLFIVRKISHCGQFRHLPD